MAFPVKNSTREGQEKVPWVSQISLNPMVIVPAMAMVKPILICEEIGSLRIIGEKMATHSGVVVAKTTELATLVNSREVIQVAKWSARKTPDNKARNRSFLDSRLKSLRYLKYVTGANTRVAIPKRCAAIVIELASVCARRIKMDAAETAKMPKSNANFGGTIGVDEWFFMKFYRA